MILLINLSIAKPIYQCQNRGWAAGPFNAKINTKTDKIYDFLLAEKKQFSA